MTSLRPVRPASATPDSLSATMRPGLPVAARRALARCAPATSLVALLCVLTLVSATAAAAQESGALTGRVLEQDNSQPIADVVVRLHDLGISTVTDADGMFRFTDVPGGAHILVVEHLAYGDQSREIAVNPGEDLRLDVRLSPRTIELEPLVVEAVTELERRRISTGHSINEVGPAQLSEAARRGLALSDVLAQHLPGLRVRSGRTGSCVEYRSTSAQGGCNDVSIYVDGVRSAVPSLLYFSMPLDDIERVELLSPPAGIDQVRHGSGRGRAAGGDQDRAAAQARGGERGSGDRLRLVSGGAALRMGAGLRQLRGGERGRPGGRARSGQPMPRNRYRSSEASARAVQAS